MFWYMLEPRSKNYDYDDHSENHGLCLSDVLLLPLLPVVFVVMACISLMPVIAFFLYYLSDVYNTTKKTIQTGKTAYPFMANLGSFLIVFLLLAVDIDFFPFKLIASVFIFNHTILPYAAVFIYKLKSLFGTEIA